MDKTQAQTALKQVLENSSKRNFKQTIDLIINLKGLDLKKQENKIDTYAQLHFPRGKKVKICGLVGPELQDSAKSNFDAIVNVDEFPKYNKNKIKLLAKNCSFFVAQATIMPKVATTFGKILGPRGKMPNPKAGCVVPPNANLQPLAEKLQKTLRIKIDSQPLFQTYVGMQDSPQDQVIDNIMTIYNAVIHALPNEHHNIKDVYLKLTMGVSIKITK